MRIFCMGLSILKTYGNIGRIFIKLGMNTMQLDVTFLLSFFRNISSTNTTETRLASFIAGS
jgi:hypothetical protein